LISHLARAKGKNFFANEISEPRAALAKKVVGSYPVIVLVPN
jgi:hypothetical protein